MYQHRNLHMYTDIYVSGVDFITYKYVRKRYITAYDYVKGIDYMNTYIYVRGTCWVEMGERRTLPS